MNGLGIHPGVPDLAATAFEFAVNWLVQSTLILTAGLIIGRLLTTRGSAVQSLVYRTTLVAVLACPLATCLLSFCGVSGWSIKLPRDSRLENVDHVKRKGAVLDPFVALHVGEPPADRARPAEPSAPVGSELPMDNYQLAPSAAMSGSIVPANDVASVTASSTADQFPRPVPSDMPHSLLGIATLAAVLIWLGVSGVLAMRIAMAWTALQRLRRHAVHAEAETTAICRELSSRLGVSAPDVLRSPWLPSPCLAGIRRPSVLLPDTDKVLSVRDVLIHELAHLKRHDCHWNVLRRAATAVLWFQPLLWRLSSRLESTSDEVCDDYVIDLGGDRHEYAHQLVDIAELSSAPIGVAGVGIVSLHSMLARRVTRIMDPSRNLSMRVGNLLLAAVLAGGLLGTAFTGLVGLSPRATRADSEPDAEAKVVVGKDESRSTIQENGDVITIRGQVVDPDGSPSAGATIHIARWYWDPNVPKVPLATTVSDADGQFEVSYRKSQFNVDVQRPEMWKEVTIVASAANYGPAFVNRTDVDSNQDLTLRLVHDDVPIRGRVIDLEGNPISRVTVSVGSLAAAPEEKLDAWLDALRRGEVLWEARNRYLGKYTPDNPPGVPRAVVTDADGYFEFKGVGRERQIRVTFEGPTIAYSEATIVTRKIEPVVAIDGMPDPVWSRKHTVYGANCEIAVHPTQPVVGTVRDAETGEPLSGVAVEAYRMTERGISAQRQIRITSDNQGRYKLVGMPKGPGNQIIAVPNDDQPYLMREFDVPDQPGLEPIELNLELHRGVWITGRVIDRATDKPVAARVHYLPYRTNPFAQAITGSDGGRLDGYQSRYATDEAGNYRLVGLPGPAIVGVQCISNSFPRGMGHETISGLDERGNFPTYRNPILPGKSWPTAMKEIDIAQGAESVQLDFSLDAGRSVNIVTIDPEGHPVAGVNVAGKDHPQHWQSVSSARFAIVALAPGEQRTLLFHHAKKRLGKALRFVATDHAPKELSVQLEPCAIIRGQLVDDNEQPISGARIRISPKPGGDFHPELESIATDAEGRFIHDGVLPGASYAVMSESTRVGFKTLAEEVVVNPGETIDLGTIDITGDERPEPVRTLTELTPSDSATGKVLDPAGNPLPGVGLYFAPSAGAATDGLRRRAVTDEAGRFQFEFPRSDLTRLVDGLRSPWNSPLIVARMQGYGPAQKHIVEPRDAADVELRLVSDDVPIRGRIVDLEGQPVAGAILHIRELRGATPGGNLARWLQSLRDHGQYWNTSGVRLEETIPPGLSGLPAQVTTDDNGEFRLTGVGRERVVDLRLEAAGLETSEFSVMSRDEPAIRIPYNTRAAADGRFLGTFICYGSTFTHSAAPSRAVEGTVRDASTREPIPGVVIYCRKRAGNDLSGRFAPETTSDANGRYVLSGLPKGAENVITFVPPTGAPYVASSLVVDTSQGLKAKSADVDLHRGLLIRGRITDRSNGEPIAGARVEYFALLNDNPQVAQFPGFRNTDEHTTTTDNDGQYEIVGLPGRGLIAVRAASDEFAAGIELDVRPSDYEDNAQLRGRFFHTDPHICQSTEHHAVAVVEPRDDALVATRDIALERGTTLQALVVDQNGWPLAGAAAERRGIYGCQWFGGDVQLESDRFTIYGLIPEKPRRLFLHHRSLGLVGGFVVSAGDVAPVEMRLFPTGKITGRVVDEDGQPVRYKRLSTGFASGQGEFSGYFANTSTDDVGRFTFDAMIPGLQFQIREVYNSAGGYVLVPDESSSQAAVFTLGSGETRNLGYILMTDAANLTAADKTLESAAVPTSAQGAIAGRITLIDDRPAAGAHVAVIANRIRTARGGDLSRSDEVLAEGQAAEDGSYRLNLIGVSSRTHRDATIVARSNGTAIAWQRINLDTENIEASLDLQPEEPIKGKLVNIEGQPAAGVELRVQFVMQRARGDFPSRDSDRVVGFHGARAPAAWPKPLWTNEQGQFTVRGVPEGHGVLLEVPASDYFAPQEIALNTGMPEQRGERDGTYRPLVKNVDAGQEAVLPLAPAQIFEGVVTYEDTGRPAPHARLTIWASQEEYGSMVSVSGTADAEGRYRIHPKPGIRFGVIAYPPDGVPYLARQSSLANAIRWREGDGLRQYNVSLPRGILIRGKIVETGTAVAVSRATIQYIPQEADNQNAAEDIVTGWQGIQLSNERGEFEIAVLPGPGWLLVHGSEGKYVLQEIAGRQLVGSKPGGRRNYAHAIHKVNPDPGAAPIEMEIALRPGATVTGMIVDEQHKPVDEVLLISRLVLAPGSLEWRGQMPPTLGGRFELSGLDDGTEYPVHFLAAKRRLGASVSLRADRGTTTVVLHPCGTAHARFIDSEGRPHVGYRPGLRMAITPGAFALDFDAMHRGELAADEDFVANINQSQLYWAGPLSDEDGKVTFEELIPGASYRVWSLQKGEHKLLKQFTVKPGENLDLGELTIERND